MDAYAIGRSFGTIVKRDGGPKVAVGYDGRLSSIDLANSLVRGLNDAGIDVLQVGRGPTPMLYYSVYHLQANAGIMVTGSHNPPEYNGFKMLTSAGAFYGEDIQDLGSIAASGAFASGTGLTEQHSMLEAYVDRVFADYRDGHELHVAWDAGNGSAGQAMEMLCHRLPGQHHLLNERIDGTFPAHHPDPTLPENFFAYAGEVVTPGDVSDKP